MKAIFINAAEQTVTEVEVSSSNTLKDWYRIMGVDLVEVAHYIDDHDSILVDEEGLLKPLKHFFYYSDAPQPYAGNGLVVGVNEEGESVSCNATLEQIKRKTYFPTLEQIKNSV